MKITDLLKDEVVDSYSVRVPTYVNVSRKNQKPVNLNVYRNLHHHHLNTQKKNFADEVKPLLRDKPRADRVWIHYTIYAPRNGRLDTMNVGSITDKYFSDAMVEAGKLPDDNQEHIVLSTFSFGGVLPMEGHAIATVNILKKESTNMRVMLDEDDIHAALDAYLKTLNLPGATGVELSVTDSGEIEAEVLMNDAKPKNKGGRPKGSRNKTKSAPEAEEVTNDAAEVGNDDSEGSSVDTASRGSSSEATASEEEQDEPATTTGATQKGNLFADEESPSSASIGTDSESPSQATRTIRTKKPSIFDVE